MIIEPSSLRGDSTDEADYVVIGSGAAGATAARELARAGASVIIVEEGPYVRPDELGRGTVSAFTHLFRDLGAQLTSGPVKVAVLQASCVGGSTVINSGIIWRTPEKVLDAWTREHGLGSGLPPDLLSSCFETLERDLSVKPVDDDRIGGNGRVLQRGAAALSYAARPTHRTESGCEGLSRCLEGCRRGRRLSMNYSYVPQALAAGARLYTQCRVARIGVEGGRARQVLGLFRPGAPGAPRYELRARARKAVLVGASAVGTPALLQRSGLDTTGQVGRHFQGHPGVALMGVFDEPVRIWSGATQSYEVTEFRDRGFKIEGLNLPPEMLAARLPGVGHKLMSYVARLDRVAVAAVLVRARAEGSVQASGAGASIHYTPGPGDVATALEGLARTAEVFFAAGARVILPGIHGVPEAIEGRDGIELIRRAEVGPQAFPWVMTHLMGSCRMGPDPGTSAVDPSGQLHGVSGLHVIDSSVFPTNLGVNPQHTIMAIAMLIARRLLGHVPPVTV